MVEHGPQPHLVERNPILDAVADAFCLTISPESPRRLGGAVNQVLRVMTSDGEVIVRIHRPETTPERLSAVHRIQETLRATGLPIPAVLRTCEGQSWISLDGRLVEVLEFVPGGHQVRSWEDARAVFTELGRVHAALREIDAPELPPPPFGCYASPESALALFPATEAGFHAEAENVRYPQAAEVRAATLALVRRLVAARRSYEAELPRILLHGDFVGNNVLVDVDRVIAILDFDRLTLGHRVFEIAYTLMYVLSCVVYPSCVAYPTASAWPDGAFLDEDELNRVAELLDAYATASRWPLTPAERHALAFEMAAVPVYPIAMAGSDPGQAVLETLIFAQHIPLAEWLVEHAGHVSATLFGSHPE